jgi:hypothetical protein
MKFFNTLLKPFVFLSDSDTFFSSCHATFPPRGSDSSASACCKAGQTRFRFSARHPSGPPLLSGVVTSIIYKYCMSAQLM